MNKQKLYDAYDNISMSSEDRKKLLERIISASSCKPTERKKIPMKKTNLRRVVYIAAVVILCLALTVTVYAADRLGLWDVLLKTKPDNPFVFGDYEIVSLQGLQDSPGYQAAEEWFAFDNSYDPDYEIMTSVDDYSIFSDYFAYGCYSHEMTEKIDEICEKYGLVKHTERTDYYTAQELFDSVGIETIFSTADAEHDFLWGYSYDDGTFQMEDDVTLTLHDQTHITIPYQLRCVQKNALDTVTLNIGQLEEYEEWRYKTASGVELTIATKGSKGLLLIDREDAHITVNIVENLNGNINIREIMEAFAETFDFSNID